MRAAALEVSYSEKSSQSCSLDGRRAVLLFPAMDGTKPQPRLQPVGAPTDAQVEQALLGALIIDGEALYGVSLIINEECFSAPVHRRIYAALLSLQGRGLSIDIHSVYAAVRSYPELIAVGGLQYLVGLTFLVASAAHAMTHAKLLREHWTRRRLTDIGDGLLRSTDAEDVFDTIDTTQDELSSLITTLPTERPSKLDKLVNDALLLADKLRKERESGVHTVGMATGYATLDGLLCGMMGGELHVLAARPSVGKTAFALGLAVAAARAQKRTLFFSLEMSKAQLGLRTLSLIGGANHGRLLRGELNEQELAELGQRALETASLPVWVDDSGAIRLNELCAKARAMAAGESGVDFILVDYLQLVTVPNVRGNVPREQIVGQISRTLKALAKELNVPVLALAQLNRGVETRAEKRPALADLRESGSIEQDADSVMMLHAPSRYGMRQYPDGSSAEGVVELHLLKNRKGQAGTVYFEFDGEQMRFVESRCQDDRYQRVQPAATAFEERVVGERAKPRWEQARREELLCTPSALPTYLDVMQAKAEAEAKGEDEGLPF